MDNKEEPITRTIPGYPDYEVSACGRIWSNRTETRKELKGSQNLQEYHQVTLRLPQNGPQVTKGFHVFVAMAWLPDYDPSLQVNHIDGNKLNNHVSNLEIVTRSKNMRSYSAIRTDNKSGLRAVSKIGTGTNPWFGSAINGLGKRIYTKGYPTREQAAFARDILALKFGYTKEALNYPENYHRYMWELKSQQTLKI